MSVKISIIIVTYKSEKYIPECIQSIEKQTYDINKIQIVLINDGLSQNKRILQAIMISEYRQIVASKFLNKSIKPVIMFKNPKGIKNIDKNFDDFINLIDNLKPKDLEDIFENSDLKAIKELQKLINIDDFTKRLKYSFAKDKCLVIYSTSEDKLEKLEKTRESGE